MWVGGFVNLLNQEIRCIRQTIVEKRRMMNLESNQTEKEKLRREILELQLFLNEKLFELLEGEKI